MVNSYWKVTECQRGVNSLLDCHLIFPTPDDQMPALTYLPGEDIETETATWTVIPSESGEAGIRVRLTDPRANPSAMGLVSRSSKHGD